MLFTLKLKITFYSPYKQFIKSIECIQMMGGGGGGGGGGNNHFSGHVHFGSSIAGKGLDEDGLSVSNWGRCLDMILQGRIQ